MVPSDGRRLLIVDDNRDAADSLALLLDLWGYSPRVAYDATSALELARAETADGVLLDLGLPGVDGFQLATDLRRRPDWADVPLIAVTGHSEAEHRRRARTIGFSHFLVKPVDPVGLQRLLGDLLRLRLLSVRLDGLARRHAELAHEGATLVEEVRRQAELLRQKLRDDADD
jgi:DNA-binding response OmpR family regulator